MDDLIIRQAVIDAFWKLNVELRPSAIDAILSMVNDMPSVSTEKTGYWIKIKPYPLQMHDYECSECGHETDDSTEKDCSECCCRMTEMEE